jgi:hypothetical protein
VLRIGNVHRAQFDYLRNARVEDILEIPKLVPECAPVFVASRNEDPGSGRGTNTPLPVPGDRIEVLLNDRFILRESSISNRLYLVCG